MATFTNRCVNYSTNALFCPAKTTKPCEKIYFLVKNSRDVSFLQKSFSKIQRLYPYKKAFLSKGF
jgi:hypothetical protein